MKKSKLILKIVLFSLLINVVNPLFAEDTTPLPYKKNEFPQGLKDLRRFEIISIGALPFVTINTSLVYSGIRYGKHGFSQEYAPNPFAVSTYTAEEQREILLTSLAISVGIGLTDYIIQLIKRNKKNKQRELEREDLYIIPLAEDPNATLIDFSNSSDSDSTPDNSSSVDDTNAPSETITEENEFYNVPEVEE